MTLTAETRSTGVFGTTNATRTTTCRVDLKALRDELQKNGCLTDTERLPLRQSPLCVQQKAP